MLMYPKGSKDGVLISQAQVKTLERAGWTKKVGKLEVKEKTQEKVVSAVKKAEPAKVATAMATPKVIQSKPVAKPVSKSADK